MRCRAGDTAVIVNDFEFPENNGALVEVVAFAGEWRHDRRPHWIVQALGRPLLCQDFDLYDRRIWPNAYYMECETPDDEMRPLRDPGDDAVDQMIERAGKPNEVTA